MCSRRRRWAFLEVPTKESSCRSCFPKRWPEAIRLPDWWLFLDRKSTLKTEDTLQASIPVDVLQLAERFLDSDLGNFADQVRFLNLNPARDLRHADLADVDLSNSDLRGFDFTDADLRGAFGVNVVWDASTCFEGAHTENSVFSYLLSKKEFLEANPDYADRVARLRNEHWANVILAVEGMLRADRESGNALKIAKAVFDDSKNLTVKAEILLYLGLAVDTKEEHKAFIYHTLAQFEQKPSVLRSCIRTLRSLYVHDLDAFNVMTRFIGHSDEKISQEAATGVLSSKHLLDAPERVRKALLSSEFSLTRRAYVERVAKIELRQSCELLLDTTVNGYLDFVKPISNDTILRMSRRSLMNPSLDGLEARRTIASMVDPRPQGFLSVAHDSVLLRARLIKKVLGTIRGKYGVPFQTEQAALPDEII
ncbi:hypothetical protein BSZ22_20520 [Bradyrhizobium canariense]|uniref:Pentapeptide repeat-containing protein n=1 Tax=Bradyrhizobium canariense TaxID=255045 RepID=A0A1X3GN22_9BRAD|nr:hypothetical protein BSZ22_20520 [Bradyrhizobium canariense]OSI78009.1 hypothetical protein BSZ23_19520 [Bradyrhizobium canariense]OSI89238.1 hypothetical protein BSZ25_20990 [Bradyrhizobium canariense]OSI93721.1 hypothetical protein BSZ24_12220 [Bradyrhizobium canariense]OSJ03037.1 hypothetical protein BSZ16_16415 [Bradyrhizobium canariense]